MKRLGKFTKTIYDETFDFSKCPECCTQITDEQANDESFLEDKHMKDLLDCVRCFGCPAAKGGAE